MDKADMKNTDFILASLNLDDWTFYSNDTPPDEYELYRQNVEKTFSIHVEKKDITEVLPSGDKERLKKGDKLLRLIAEKKAQNPKVGVEHHFKIYFDWAYAGVNRMLLTCDDESLDCQMELGLLMAEADYLIHSEHLGSFERMENDPLVLMFITDKCLNCEENRI